MHHTSNVLPEQVIRLGNKPQDDVAEFVIPIGRYLEVLHEGLIPLVDKVERILKPEMLIVKATFKMLFKPCQPGLEGIRQNRSRMNVWSNVIGRGMRHGSTNRLHHRRPRLGNF